MAPYVKADLGKAIFEINTAGVESPLDLALDAATADLKPLAGKSAVIIFTDGLEMPKAVASAQAMKAALKDNVCIYAVLIGDDVMTLDYPQGEGKALLDKVVKAGQCGFMVKGKDVETRRRHGRLRGEDLPRSCRGSRCPLPRASPGG